MRKPILVSNPRQSTINCEAQALDHKSTQRTLIRKSTVRIVGRNPGPQALGTEHYSLMPVWRPLGNIISKLPT